MILIRTLQSLLLIMILTISVGAYLGYKGDRIKLLKYNQLKIERNNLK